MPSELARRIAERMVNDRRRDTASIIDDELAAVRKALEKLRAQVACSNPTHRKLRHPMCGNCQALGRIENALADLEVKP